MKCTSLLPRALAGGGMLYQAYQAHCDIMGPVRLLADMAVKAVGPLNGAAHHSALRNLTAAYELIARAGLTHTRPLFGIASVTVGNREVAVREEAALVTPFATLLRFRKDVDTAQPRVLLVAPLSGHFATLLRSTVRTLLPEHDVYITDWPTRATSRSCTGASASTTTSRISSVSSRRSGPPRTRSQCASRASRC
jgi:polyhydroxyalkanoate depolymerase